MGSVKKTTWMAAGSLALLLGLGYADPGHTRLMPDYQGHMVGAILNLARIGAARLTPSGSAELAGALPQGAVDQSGLTQAIVDFNRRLSAAYLALDPAALAGPALDSGLMQHYVEEIDFLKNDGRALELTVRDIRIKEVTRPAGSNWNVNTTETVRVRYLHPTRRTEILAFPEAVYSMNYTLGKDASGWKLVGVETMKVGGRDE